MFKEVFGFTHFKSTFFVTQKSKAMVLNGGYFYDFLKGNYPIFGRFAYDFFKVAHSQNLPNASSNGGRARTLKI